MVRTENHCWHCAVPGYPCQGNACPNRNVKVYYCDKCDPKCEHPLEEVYVKNRKHFCEDCFNKMFLKEI